MIGNGPEESPPSTQSRPFRRATLRQATLILPKTGERIKKSFTLRHSASSSSPNANVRTPLLSRRVSFNRPSSLQRFWASAKEIFRHLYEFWTSRLGIGILKCSIAYTLGSLATLVPLIAAVLGRNDGKHMVATVCVYFHPARSFGSMLEATFFALVAFGYAAFVSFTSMAVTVFFGAQHLLVVGHVIVLIVFCGGGLGLVGWLKQKLGNPLVNVACSLTSLAIITVLTKEEAVHVGSFSYAKILQVLKMVLMGMAATTVVNLLVKPLSARNELRNDLVRVTDSLEEIFTTITRSFLSGSEADLKAASYREVLNKYKLVFKSLLKNLGEAKTEHYFFGTETEYKIEARLVKCIERLAQSLSGLRSAAETQFSLLARPGYDISSSAHLRLDSISSSPLLSPELVTNLDRLKHLGSITEEPENPFDSFGSPSNDGMEESQSSINVQNASSPSDIFSLFISQLGPPMKSLAYTLKEVLGELPFEPGPEHCITINSNFRSSLVDAKDLYSGARRDALESLYNNRALARSRSSEVAADFEEVAASCGHFSSSLQDFAEDTIAYLDILEELEEVIEQKPRRRSWKWLRFWSKGAGTKPACAESNEPLLRQQRSMPTPKHNPITKPTTERPDLNKRMYIFLWRTFSFLRREDLRFAIKVGVGAILYAVFSFIPSTRPFYSHWRGEWGLLSYMLVCSMTIGASNTTGLQRFFGTCLGAVFAIVAWIVAHESPYVLGLLGWFVSLGCFYIILGLGKGPMGRFILLTYNLSALYAYSLSVKDDDDDDDEGGVSPEIWEIVLHRTVAVLVGCLWGLVVTRVVYPISARRKLKRGLALLWLRMGLIWKRDPLTILTEHDTRSSYMDIRESLELQRFLTFLEGLRESASHEFELRGPFPDELTKQILDATGRMLGAFHAMNVVIMKDLKASPGEAELLSYTRAERVQLSARISHLFSVLASSVKLEYPITDAVPSIEHTRDRFLAKLFDFRKNAPGRGVATDEDFELLYAYALVTGQIANEIESVARTLEQLYGVLNEDSLTLR